MVGRINHSYNRADFGWYSKTNLRVKNNQLTCCTKHKYVADNPQSCILVTNGSDITALRDGFWLLASHGKRPICLLRVFE